MFAFNKPKYQSLCTDRIAALKQLDSAFTFNIFLQINLLDASFHCY